MIDLYFWPTGNGKKISIMLEETGLPYRVIPININNLNTVKEIYRTENFGAPAPTGPRGTLAQ